MRMHRLALHLTGVLSCSAALSALVLKSQLFLLVRLIKILGGCLTLPWVTSWTALAQVWATPCRLALGMSDTWAWCKPQLQQNRQILSAAAIRATAAAYVKFVMSCT